MTNRALCRSGVGTTPVPKEQVGSLLRPEFRTIDRHQVASAAAPCVDPLGDEFLPRSRFAHEQDWNATDGKSVSVRNRVEHDLRDRDDLGTRVSRNQ
jgi:hypothetical protein